MIQHENEGREVEHAEVEEAEVVRDARRVVHGLVWLVLVGPYVVWLCALVLHFCSGEADAQSPIALLFAGAPWSLSLLYLAWLAEIPTADRSPQVLAWGVLLVTPLFNLVLLWWLSICLSRWIVRVRSSSSHPSVTEP